MEGWAQRNCESRLREARRDLFTPSPDFYFATHAKDLRIEAIITAQGLVKRVASSEPKVSEIVLDRTPFYAESGGQQSDIGTIWNNERTMELATVRGAYHPLSGLVAHRVVAKEALHVGDRVAGEADSARRERIKRNHTATHLMHAALRSILGTHVKQAGSQVAPERLRFDFSHFATVDAAELLDIEQMVNDQIRQNSEITTDVTTLDDALTSGALAFFGDRYPEQNVRVVTVIDPNMPARLLQQGAMRRHTRKARGRCRHLQGSGGAIHCRRRAAH